VAAPKSHWPVARLLDCLPALQHDPSRPELVLKLDADEEGIGSDDAADALRYLVATKARTVSQAKLRGVVRVGDYHVSRVLPFLAMIKVFGTSFAS